MTPAWNPQETEAADFRVTPRLVIGLAIMLAGLVLALDSLGIMDGTFVFRYWPLALVAVGVVKLLSPSRGSAGIVWIVAGVGFLLVSLGRMSFVGIWAMVIFFVGANIVWRALRPVPAAPASTSVVDVVQFLGGNKTVVSGEFRGGQAMAVMGGAEIDLNRAELPEGGDAVLDTFAFWGGVVVYVPDEWQVISRGNAFLGGFVNNARPAPGAARRLVVTGTAIMGGVEIKNF